MFRATLRYVALLAISLWIGSLLFFGAVVAPVAFTVLNSRHDAGLVVGASLRILHDMGLGLGALAVAASLFRGGRSGLRSSAAVVTLVLLMMLLTSVSKFGIMPAMERHRSAYSGQQVVPATNPDLIAFNRLHSYSTWTESGVFIAGLVVLGCL